MTNKYANLDGTKPIMDEFTKINTGFDGVDADIKDLAGTGRTTQTVKKNADDLATHKTEKASDDVHGLLTDGKIISEVGSNANGKYVRFADGTQICFYTGYVTTGVSVAANASLNFRLTYPAAFVSGSNVAANVIVAYAFSGGGLETEIRPLGNVSSGAYHEDSGTTTTKRKLYYNRGSSTADRYAVEMYAIGRWK